MDYLKSFLIGGAICLVGQLLIDKTKLTPARILVSYVVAGVILGAVGLYAPFAEFAGAGAAVPLTGFGNTLAKGVREAVDEQGFLGIFTGGLKATAGGITAAILAGLLAALLFRPKDKSCKPGHTIHAATAAARRIIRYEERAEPQSESEPAESAEPESAEQEPESEPALILSLAASPGFR